MRPQHHATRDATHAACPPCSSTKVEESSNKAGRPSAVVALEKVYNELLLEHDELVAISEVLKAELAIEKSRVRFSSSSTKSFVPLSGGSFANRCVGERM